MYHSLFILADSAKVIPGGLECGHNGLLTVYVYALDLILKNHLKSIFYKTNSEEASSDCVESSWFKSGTKGVEMGHNFGRVYFSQRNRGKS